MKAFEWRQKEGNKYSKLRANFFKKLIEDIDKKQVKWENDEINKEMKRRYKDTFFEEVNTRNMNTYAKKWH